MPARNSAEKQEKDHASQKITHNLMPPRAKCWAAIRSAQHALGKDLREVGLVF
jgi:hypothetical protein